MRPADSWKDYELLDATGGNRLERWGETILIRPDPQVVWKTESGLITHGFLLSIYLQEMSSISLLGAFALLHTGKRDLLGLFARIFLPRPSFSSVCRKSAINFATLDFVFSSPEEILFRFINIR